MNPPAVEQETVTDLMHTFRCVHGNITDECDKCNSSTTDYVFREKEPSDRNALNLQIALEALQEIGVNQLRQGDAIWMRDTAQDALDKIRLSSHAPESSSGAESEKEGK